ncbi:MAG: HEAT repeat domain-containing protein [Leptolyngbyaceae cyanobacterium]|mgnify:CR=1 FL=1
MKDKVFRQLFKRLAASVGIFPLLTADISLAISSSQIYPNQGLQLAQNSGNGCQNLLDRPVSDPSFSNQLYNAISFIDNCSPEELPRLFDQLVETLNSPHDGSLTVLILHTLGAIIRAPEADITHEQTDNLLSQIDKILDSQSSVDSVESWQLKTAAVALLSDITLFSIDTSTSGERHLEKLISFFADRNDNTQLIPLAITDIEDIKAFRERLNAGRNASDEAKNQAAQYRASVAFHLAALKTLKDIGQKLQTQLEHAEADSETASHQSPSRTQLELLLSYVNDHLKRYLETVLKVENRDVVSDALLIDIRIATIDAVAALILYPHSSAATASDNVCTISSSSSGEERNNQHDDDRYAPLTPSLCLLNMIAANKQETGEVRASAIAAIERLGSRGNQFYTFVVSNLYSVTQNPPNLEDDQSDPDSNRPYIEREDSNLPDPIAQQLSAIDIASRLESRAYSQESADAIEFDPQLRPRPYSQQADNLIAILTQGFGEDENDELRQRAEVTFRQFYADRLNDDTADDSYALNELVRTAERSITNGSRNPRLQLSAVKAAGGINYRRLRFPEYDLSLLTLNSVNNLPSEGHSLIVAAKIGNFYHIRIFDRAGNIVVDKGVDEFTPNPTLINELNTLISSRSIAIAPERKRELAQKITSNVGYIHTSSLKKLAVFLGKSLSSDSWEIRQQAAYALGQMAPHWSNVFQSETFNHDVPGNDSKIEVNILEALLLGLNDSGYEDRENSEKVIATMAFAVSQYGRALDYELKKAELKKHLLLEPNQRDVLKHQLSALKTCLIAITIPTSNDLDEFDTQARLENVLFEKIKDTRAAEVKQAVSTGRTVYEKLLSDFREEAAVIAAEILDDETIGWHRRSNELHSKCTLTIPDTAVGKTDRATIAATFALGQIGISDGITENISEEEKNTIDSLLWVLQVRDIIAVDTDTNTFTPDSVRDSIANYVFAQVDSREHELIEQLLARVTLANTNNQQTSAESIKDSYLEYLQNPVTRATVIEALDQVALERGSLQAFIGYDHSDSSTEFRRFRRILSSDPDPTDRVQASVTSAIASAHDRADQEIQELWNALDYLNEQETEGSDRWLNTVDQRRLMQLTQSMRDAIKEELGNIYYGSPDSERLTNLRQEFTKRLSQNLRQRFKADLEANYDVVDSLNQARNTLSFTHSSLVACTGSSYTLEATGVDSDRAVEELMKRIYVYPQPYRHFCASNRRPVSNLENPGNREPALNEDPLVDQLVLMKSAAIAALGQVDLYYGRRPFVIKCLADLAGSQTRNLTPDGDCPVRRPTYVSRTGENGEAQRTRLVAAQDPEAEEERLLQAWCLTPRQYAQFENHAYFERYRNFDSLEYGIVSHDRRQDRLTASQIDTSDVDTSDYELPDSECPAKDELDNGQLPERLPDAEQFPAAYQAEGWGLNASEYYFLRRELQRPAMEALGQIALRETDNRALKELVTLKPPLELGNASASNEEITLESPDYIALVEILQDIALYAESSNRFDHNTKREKFDLIINSYLLPIVSTRVSTLAFDRPQLRLHEAAVEALSLLGPVAFKEFSLAERRAFITEGLGFQPSGLKIDSLAKVCLEPTISRDPNNTLDEAEQLLLRESRCIALSNLLISVWDSELDDDFNVVASLKDLAELAKNTAGVGNNASSSTVIQTNAIRALGTINRGSESNSYYSVFFDSLGTSEARIEARSIESLLQAPPEAVLQQWIELNLKIGDEDRVRQTARAVRLIGQITYGVDAESDPNFLAWQTALQDSNIAEALVNRLSQTNTTTLRNEIIYALGELRSDDIGTWQALDTIMNSSGSDAERAAAAYALGNIGNAHPRVGAEIQQSLGQIALNASGTVAPEVQTAAAYALSQIGINAYSTPDNIDPNQVLGALIGLYRSDQANDSDELRAVLLYSMGRLGFENNQVLNIFADALKPEQPFNVRVVAATYAGELMKCETTEESDECISSPRWNEQLTQALIKAVTDDRDITVRRNAALALGHPINFPSETTNEQYQEEILDALSDAFWNGREYPSVRIAAGEAIQAIWSKSGTGHYNEIFSENNNLPDLDSPQDPLENGNLPVAFANTFENLAIVEELRSGLRAPQVGSVEQVLFSTRSFTLIAALDSASVDAVLVLILNQLRTNPALFPEYARQRAARVAEQRREQQQRNASQNRNARGRRTQPRSQIRSRQ